MAPPCWGGTRFGTIQTDRFLVYTTAPCYPRRMPRIKRLNRAETRNVKRQQQAWALRDAGASYTEIGASLGISRQHAHRLVQRELDLIRAETREHAESYRVRELSRCDSVIREATRTMMAQCRTCKGQGMLYPDGPVSLPGEETECNDCAGTGKRYGIDWRLKAMDRVMRAVSERAKMLGLYAPEKLALTDSAGHDFISRELATMTEADLDAELAQLLPADDETYDAYMDSAN